MQTFKYFIETLYNPCHWGQDKNLHYWLDMFYLILTVYNYILGNITQCLWAMCLLGSGIQSIKHGAMDSCTPHCWHLNTFCNSTCWLRSCQHAFNQSDERKREEWSLRVKFDYFMISPDPKPIFQQTNHWQLWFIYIQIYYLYPSTEHLSDANEKLPVNCIDQYQHIIHKIIRNYLLPLRSKPSLTDNYLCDFWQNLF